MAKNIKRIAAFGTALVMTASMMTIPAFAGGHGGGGGHGDGGGGGHGSGTEYVGISINGGETVIIDSSNGPQSYTGTLAGDYEFGQTGAVDSSNISGVNDDRSTYDNIVININANNTNTDPDATEPTGPIINFEPEKPTESPLSPRPSLRPSPWQSPPTILL